MLRRIVVQLEWVRLFSLRIYRNLGWGRTGSRKVVRESGKKQGLKYGRRLKSEKKVASEIGLMARVAQGYIRTRYLILNLNLFALFDINSL